MTPELKEKEKFYLIIDIPILPQGMNMTGSKNWRAVAAKRAAVKRLVMQHLMLYPKPKEPLKHANLLLIRYSSREPDFDGLVSSFKAVVDALVTGKIIEDDSPKHIGQPGYLWRPVKPRKGKIRIQLWEEGANLWPGTPMKPTATLEVF